MKKNHINKVIIISIIIIINLILIVFTVTSVTKSAKKVLNNEVPISEENIIESHLEDLSSDNIENAEDVENNISENEMNISEKLEILQNFKFNISEIIKAILVIIGLNLVVLSVFIWIKLK